MGFALPPLPAIEPDAAANDRFGSRLRRSALAVIHQPAPCVSDERKMPKRPAAVTDAKSGKSQ